MKWSDGLVEDNRTIVEILQEAKELISNPENWCQGDLYQREDGSPVTTAHAESICRYCSVGAIYKTVPWGNTNAGKNHWSVMSYLERAIDLRSKVSRSHEIVDFNDTNPHSEVMKMWDDAIRIAKEDYESNI